MNIDTFSSLSCEFRLALCLQRSINGERAFAKNDQKLPSMNWENTDKIPSSLIALYIPTRLIDLIITKNVRTIPCGTCSLTS